MYTLNVDHGFDEGNIIATQVHAYGEDLLSMKKPWPNGLLEILIKDIKSKGESKLLNLIIIVICC